MLLSQWLLVLIVVIPLTLVITNRLRMDVAALLMALLLGILQFAGLGMLGPANTPKDAVKAVSGFSQPVVVTLLSLFIITRGLENSGITRWMARQLLRLGGNNEGRLIALFASTAAFLSLLMNNLAAAALVLPSAMEVSRRTGIRPSKLLIPVAYGSLLGGSATYFTTANIIISDLLTIAHPPQPPLNILDFTPTGGLIAIAGILYLWLFGSRLLPAHTPSAEQSLVRHTGSELENLYQLGERLWEAVISDNSPLVGKTLAESKIGKNWGVSVAAIHRAKKDLLLPSAGQELERGDNLLLIGREEKIAQMACLSLTIQPVRQNESLSQRGITFAEALLNPHSTITGKTLKEIDFRQRCGLSVVALKRLNRSHRTDVGVIPLALGDSLLVIGTAERIQAFKRSSDFLLLEPSQSDQPVNLRQAIYSVTITLAAITASIAGVPVFLSVFAGALLIILLHIVTMEEAYRAVEWQAIFLITGMYAVSLAMVQTGLADLLGKTLLGIVLPLGPLGVAAGGYLLSALLTQFMGGQVTALVTGPVVISAAISMGANPHAAAVATAIGCSASFLTPMAHPVNIIMLAPANYKFSDFPRIGWPLTVLSFLMLIVGLILFWRLPI
jgi:di/tricarboxylate transporter